MKISTFQKTIWEYYRVSGRHDLPWRKTNKIYTILVSEVMLQQTQVNRVKDKYLLWVKKYPNFASLATADLREVLLCWQGLGYSRRAKYLYQTAQIVMENYAGSLPKNISVQQLESFPGIGPYTARAIKTFTSNSPEVFIETNIRTVFLYFFYKNQDNVTDAEILSKIETCIDYSNPREWYFALMDYGSYLKSLGVKNNNKSKSYVLSKKFIGSNRQARGLILKYVLGIKSVTKDKLAQELDLEIKVFNKALSELVNEGFLTIDKSIVSING